MRPGYLLTLTCLLFVSAAAHADSISVFNIQGASIFYGMAGDTNTVSGTTTINTTTGVVQSISFTAGGIFQSGVDYQNAAYVRVGSSQAAFSFSTAALFGYEGSTFDLNGPNDLYVGKVTLASTTITTAVTPEPSSILLLGTGIFGVAGVVRRRFATV